MKTIHIQTSPPIIDWNSISSNAIDELNWEAFNYAPQVTFKITHCNKMLYIRFYVSEHTAVRCIETTDQSPVYQDSCVEFFFSHSDGSYLNFEANAKGTLLAAKGTSRTNRQALTAQELISIKRFTSKIVYKNNKYHWDLILGIPFDILGVATGKSYMANFYKCGDLTEQKHYLSWSPIATKKPDFHRPEFFGKITFE